MTFLCVALTSVTAQAEDGTVSPGMEELSCDATLTAEDLKNSSILTMVGVKCFKDEKFLSALKFYREAYDLSQSPFLLGAIGRVFEELGYITYAQEYYQRFMRRSVDKDPRIKKRLDQINAKVKQDGERFTIDSVPTHAKIYLLIGNERYMEPLGETPVKVKFVSGVYSFIVEKEGFQVKEDTISVPNSVSSNGEYVFHLNPDGIMRLSTRNDVWDRLSIYTYFASTPVLVAGITALAIGIDKKHDSETLFGAQRQETADKGDRLKIAGYSLIGFGVAGLAAATAFQLLSVKWDYISKEGDKKVSLSTYMTPSSVGVTGSF